MNLSSGSRISEHPRVLGWFGTTSMAMGGSNQSLFLITALFVGQGSIPGQGSACILLLIVGLLLSWAAAPGWLELVLMYPNKVGGIAATCSDAFKPYCPIVSNLTGVCYWWGWVPTCGLTALFSASAINAWCLSWVPVPILATGLVLVFTFINLAGVKWAARVAMPMAVISGFLAFVSCMAPVMSGQMNWHRAFDFHLTVPFAGWFGQLTSIMSGLYLIGFAAPAFEAATCHVGESVNPEKTVPRALFASSFMAGLFFIALPLIWLGALGPDALGQDLLFVLGPTFAPVFGSGAKGAVIAFMMFNMFHGTLQPLAGASRTLAQLSEDGLLPEVFSRRSTGDVPWVSTWVTALMSIFFLWLGDPIWLVASANFTYLIGICVPNIAVWILRNDQPDAPRPYRAPYGTIGLGLVAVLCWTLSAVIGFEQFGLPTVIVGLLFAYSGSVLYLIRKMTDRVKQGKPLVMESVHSKLTSAMLAVLLFDCIGYLIAVESLRPELKPGVIAALSDIFVVVAMLSISVGLILPGIVSQTATDVSVAAERLSGGIIKEFAQAMEALGKGQLDGELPNLKIEPVKAVSRDEIGRMATSFNQLQTQILIAAKGIVEATKNLHAAQSRFKEIFFHAPIPMGVSSLEGALIMANPAYCRLLGYSEEELLQLSFQGVTHPEDLKQNLEQLHDLINGKMPICSMEKRYIAKDGRVISTILTIGVLRDQNGHPIQTMGQIIDITERKNSEAKLRQMQKMELIGQLAGGIAHDFNNILAAMNINLSLLRMERGTTDHLEVIKELELFSKEAGQLTKNLLAFSRQQPINFQNIEVNGAIEKVMPLVRRLVGPSIKVIIQKEEPLWINADPGMFDQILLNLCVNARDAMPEGGRICIETKVQSLSQEARADSPPLGDCACIVVKDSGTGMTETTLKHLFEPFFTTKEVGKGSGMGLATTHGLVGLHHGSIKVTSQWGHGSTFTILLPLIPNPAKPQPELKSEHLSIFYIEDSAQLRNSTSRLLRNIGFQIIEAEDAFAAKRLWKEHSDEIDMILSDVILPDGFMGTDLVLQFIADRPNIPTLLVSGFAKDTSAHEVFSLPNVKFLAKPYGIEELLEMLKRQRLAAP